MKITSKPSRALVHVDGRLVGKTPLTLERPRDQRARTVQVSLRGYRTHRVVLRGGSNHDLAVRLRPLPDSSPAVSVIIGSADGD